jgi:hypothetical protein
MIKRYRDLLRVVVADLRHTLSGRPNATNGGAGAQRGDLDRELERLGIAPDGAITPYSGARVKQHLTEKYPYLGGNVGFKVKDESLYLAKVLTYSTMARGSLGVRFTHLSLYDNSGSFIAPTNPSELNWLAAVLNSRVVSFLVRAISQSLSLKYMYLRDLSLPTETNRVHLERLAAYLYHLAYTRSQGLIDEESFLGAAANPDSRAPAAVQLAAEAITERLVFQAYAVDEASEHRITDETGVPAGWHPMIRDYDALPPLPAEVGLPPLLEVVPEYLQAQQSVRTHALELERIKRDLRTLYEAGPGAKPDLEEAADEQNQEEEGETTIGAAIPIPSETFLEELSQKLQIHPISVYWLLEELRAEGVRCKPEELRLLEDRLSVLVLRLLGHRWPRQIEAGEPVPSWADADGIIPLTTISGETGLAERARGRLRAEEGDRGAQQVEALLRELTGQTLEEWLRRSFFARHVRQFKHRPIAWHLASTPTKDGPNVGQGRRTKAKREPAFECLLYYHACRGDILARLRAHYVEPLIRLETSAAADARRRGDETAAAIAVSRVQELEDFATRLRDVEESGFACADLDRLLVDEPLDRWSGDGIVPPASADELAAQERAWRVDINDSVRVNVAPLQLAGLLTGDVLRPDDARKAIADRARWRSDERRWVREGVLPRCGWMDQDVPDSPRWTERAPEREAEQRKLEEKRRAVMERLS